MTDAGTQPGCTTRSQMNIQDEIQFNITLERAEVAGCVISHYVNHPTVGMSIHIASSHVLAIRPCEAASQVPGRSPISSRSSTP